VRVSCCSVHWYIFTARSLVSTVCTRNWPTKENQRHLGGSLVSEPRPLGYDLVYSEEYRQHYRPSSSLH
jgi:hypothetical protein